MEKEICICAAVRRDGKVWRGHRHQHALEAMRDELSYELSRKEIISVEVEQGFVTSLNRFVSRLEGRALQDAAEIPSAVLDGGYRGDTLFSEDLY